MRLRIAILVFGLIIISISDVYGADWKLYGSNEMYLGYYDAQGITSPSKNIVRVWQKWIYTKEGVMDTVGTLGKKFENLSHCISLEEINCAEKMNLSLSTTYYDNKGQMIYSFSPPPKWNFIVPESMAEAFYKEVCK